MVNLCIQGGRFQQTIGSGLMYDDTFDGAQLNGEMIKFKCYVLWLHGFASRGNSKSDNSSVAM